MNKAESKDQATLPPVRIQASEVSHNVLSNIGSIDRKAIPHCSIMRVLPSDMVDK